TRRAVLALRSAKRAVRTYVPMVTTRIIACAWWRPSVSERLASPKWPTPKIVVQTTVIDTMKAPAAPNPGGQRAASHNNVGNNNATGMVVFHASSGKERTIAVIPPRTASASVPSRDSLGFGGLRVAMPILITNGATTMTPRKSEANQCHQVSSIDTSGLWNRV